MKLPLIVFSGLSKFVYPLMIFILFALCLGIQWWPINSCNILLPVHNMEGLIRCLLLQVPTMHRWACTWFKSLFISHRWISTSHWYIFFVVYPRSLAFSPCWFWQRQSGNAEIFWINVAWSPTYFSCRKQNAIAFVDNVAVHFIALN